MAFDTIAGRLTALDVFRDLPLEKVERIAQIAERMVFRDRQAICRAGEEADGAVVIVAGRAQLMPDPERGIRGAPIAPGSLIGEIAILTEHCSTVTVLADGDVRAARLTRAALHELLAADRDLLDHFEGRLRARLSRMALELRLIDERLAVASLPSPPEAAAPRKLTHSAHR